MFGIIQNKKQWSWTAYGKHPSTKDYITIGREGAVFSALSNWIDSGFRSMNRDMVKGRELSWRFITNTAGDNLVCGVLKNSRDSMGRTFPLLVMGSGYLKDWADYWNYIPFACEKVWTRAEHVGAENSCNIDELEDLVGQIGKPDENYDNYKDQMSRLKDMYTNASDPDFNQAFNNKLNNIDGILRNDCFLFNFGNIGMNSLMSLFSVTRLLNVVKNRTPRPPTMVFWGGGHDDSWICLLKRPLKLEDFQMIWTIESREY